MQGSPEFFQHRTQAIKEGLRWRKANPELVAQGYRRCSACGHVGPGQDDFVPDVRCRGGYRNECRPCHNKVVAGVRDRHRDEYNAKNKAWREANPEKYRACKRATNKKYAPQIAVKRRVARLAKMGLTPEQYEAMEKAQGGVCQICSKPPTGRWKRLHIDHDHTTGAVRGLLCVGCNRAIGYLNDDPERARRVADYLDSARSVLPAVV